MKPKFQIYIAGNRIFSNTQRAFELQNSKSFGEKKENKIFYSPFECLYLVETKNAQAIKHKPLNESQIISLFSSKEKSFYVKYIVFKHLRQKGLIVKTGSKFGAEFRVYENSIRNHAKYLVYPIKQSEKTNWNEFISKARIAHSTAKILLLALVDSEDNVLFYDIEWKKI
jgi:tRNA-intron endonuclease